MAKIISINPMMHEVKFSWAFLILSGLPPEVCMTNAE